MIRLSLASLILSSCLFADPISLCTEADSGFCPSLQFTINNVDLSDQFTTTLIATTPVREYGIFGFFTDPATGLTVNFFANTIPDPSISFGIEVEGSGVADVFFSITTPYSAVHFDQFSAFYSGSGAGYNGGTLPGPGNEAFPDATYAYEFLVNGIPVDFQNLNTPGDLGVPGNFPGSGNITLEVGFSISNPGDFFGTTGTAGDAPEPGTLALMGFGALAMAGAAWRRRRIR